MASDSDFKPFDTSDLNLLCERSPLLFIIFNKDVNKLKKIYFSSEIKDIREYCDSAILDELRSYFENILGIENIHYLTIWNIFYLFISASIQRQSYEFLSEMKPKRKSIFIKDIVSLGFQLDEYDPSEIGSLIAKKLYPVMKFIINSELEEGISYILFEDLIVTLMFIGYGIRKRIKPNVIEQYIKESLKINIGLDGAES